MNKLEIIKNPIQKELADFQEIFNASLVSENPLLNEVLQHIGSKNGKMMRPVLVLLTAKLFGEVTPSTLHAAVALEMLHTASLVHDDVVDESSQRRGQPSVNALYDNKISVLVGDFLLATALIHATQTENHEIILAISRLGQKLSEGEILQLSTMRDTAFRESTYFDVILKKTAALFSACTKIAALSTGATPAEVENARLFGEYIGICFQLKDDIFDYYSDKSIGKPTGNDMKEGKLTLPILYVINNLKEESINQLALKIKRGEATEEEINQLITLARESGGIEYAQHTIRKLQAQALELLTDIPDSTIKEALITYLNYLVEREI
ncbi:MAG: polyprenyl synthetase family protein [Bacteroides sp.]|nr:polyprenyl synthetase family protein [Bacteroides sp.]